MLLTKILQCPAYNEYRIDNIDGLSIKTKADWCYKMNAACENVVECPMKAIINKLQEVKRISTQYEVQKEIQEILDFEEVKTRLV